MKQKNRKKAFRDVASSPLLSSKFSTSSPSSSPAHLFFHSKKQKQKKQGAAEQGNAPSSENPRGAGTGFGAHGEVATKGTTTKDELAALGYDPVTGALAVAVEGNPGETGMGALGGFKDPVQGNNPLPDQQERLRLAAAQALEEEEEKKKKKEGEEEGKK